MCKYHLETGGILIPYPLFPNNTHKVPLVLFCKEIRNSRISEQ